MIVSTVQPIFIEFAKASFCIKRETTMRDMINLMTFNS